MYVCVQVKLADRDKHGAGQQPSADLYISNLPLEFGAQVLQLSQNLYIPYNTASSEPDKCKPPPPPPSFSPQPDWIHVRIGAGGWRGESDAILCGCLKTRPGAQRSATMHPTQLIYMNLHHPGSCIALPVCPAYLSMFWLVYPSKQAVS